MDKAVDHDNVKQITTEIKVALFYEKKKMPRNCSEPWKLSHLVLCTEMSRDKMYTVHNDYMPKMYKPNMYTGQNV